MDADQRELRRRRLVAAAGLAVFAALAAVLIVGSSSSGVVLATSVAFVVFGLVGWRIAAGYARADRDRRAREKSLATRPEQPPT